MFEGSRQAIVLVLGSFPSDSTFLLEKCARLLAADNGVRVVCLDRAASRDLPHEDDAADARLVARQTSYGWQVDSRVAAAARLPFVTALCVWRNPAGTARYLWRGYRRFGWDVWRRFYLDARIIECRPAVVHFEFGTLAAARAYLRSLLDCRLVVSFRGYDLNYVGLDRPTQYDAVWAEADVIHVLGRDLWSRAFTRGCPRDKPVVLIPPGVDPAAFDPGDRVHDAPAGTRARPLRVLSVGRLVWKKGYEHALAAVRQLIDDGVNVEYRIVGDGDFGDAIEFARHQLNLTDAVRMVGTQTPDQVRQHLRWADVLLHAAVSEGFCNAVVEAQAMRVPVVCSDADGLAENVADGETGFVVPRRDPSAMAARLSRLAADPDLRQRMGEAGRQRVIRHFSLGNQIAAFQALYRRLLDAA